MNWTNAPGQYFGATDVHAMYTLSQWAITESASSVHGWPQWVITMRSSGKLKATSS